MPEQKASVVSSRVKSLLPLLQQSRGKTRFALAVVALLRSEDGLALDWSELAQDVGVSVQEARRLGIPADLPRCDFSQSACEKSQNSAAPRVRAFLIEKNPSDFVDPAQRANTERDQPTFSDHFVEQVRLVWPDYSPSAYERRTLDECAALEGEQYARTALAWLLHDTVALEHAKCLGGLFVKRLAPMYHARLAAGQEPMTLRPIDRVRTTAEQLPPRPSLPWLDFGWSSKPVAPLAEPEAERLEDLEQRRAEQRAEAQAERLRLEAERSRQEQARDAARRERAAYVPALVHPLLPAILVHVVATSTGQAVETVPQGITCPSVLRDGVLFVRVPTWSRGALGAWADPVNLINAHFAGAARIVVVDDDDQPVLEVETCGPLALMRGQR